MRAVEDIQRLMFLKPVDLTTALRPSLLPDETLLFVQNAVGLYEGYVDIVASAILLQYRCKGVLP
jgi:hypothetical protein